MCFILFA
jgi:hypothetical protein